MRNSLPTLLLQSVLLLASVAPASAQDCNSNNVPDTEELIADGFEPSVLASITTVGPVDAALFGDVDLDTQDDVVLANSSEGVTTITIALRDGQTFTTLPTFTLPTAIVGISLGDFDTNAFLDIGLFDGSTQTNALNLGDNSFVTVGNLPPTNQTPTPLTPAERLTVVAVDLNGDTRIDEVRVNEETDSVEFYTRGENELLTLTSTSTFTFPAGCLSATKVISILPSKDLDGDGDNDLVVTGSYSCFQPNGTLRVSNVRFFENNGVAEFETTDIEFPSVVDFVEFRNLDRGEEDEIILRSVSSTVGGRFPTAERNGVEVLSVIPTKLGADRNGNSIPDDCERAVPGDFGGDRLSDFTVVRPANGLIRWLTRHSTERSQFQSTIVDFGLAGIDQVYAGDYNGDGKFEQAVVRDAFPVIPSLYGVYWYSLQADSTIEVVQFGLPGDSPITGYFDADNKTDRAVVRQVGGQLVWFILNSATSTITTVPWGLAGDAPYAADLTNDGIAELIVSRSVGNEVLWFIRSVDGTFTTAVSWGLGNDAPQPPSDTNGDGYADLLVSRNVGPLLQTFSRLALGGSQTGNVGLRGDTPYTGHFVSEAKAEFAAFRPAPATPFLAPATHFQLTDEGLIRVLQWGLTGDVLVRPQGRP